MQTIGERLKSARETAGYKSARAAADALGVPASTYIQQENGMRGLTLEAAERYAKFFRTYPDWLLLGRAGGQPLPTVPMVGYVGAGDAAHFYANADDPNDRVYAPAYANEQTRAAEIKGTSVGTFFDGWLIFFDEARPGVPQEFLNELCVVGLPDDRILVKKVRPSQRPGYFHLLSANEPPIFDEEVLWSALVTGLQRR